MDFDDEEPSGAGEAEQGEETSTVVLMDDTSSDEDDEKDEKKKKKKKADKEEEEDEDSKARKEKRDKARKKRAEKRTKVPPFCARHKVINSVSYGDVQLDEYDTINCQGASIIEGFASEGLTAIIATQYLVDELNLPLIGEIYSHSAVPLCVVKWNQPTHAVRIYGDQRLVIFTSQKRLGPEMQNAVVDAIFDFASRHRCTHLFTLEGFAEKITIKLENEFDDLTEKIKEVATDTKFRPTRFLTNKADFGEQLDKMGHKRIRGAVISGVTGGILARAATCGDLVITGLLSPFNPMVGDARAALQLVETINTLLGDKVNIDIGQLKDTAEDVEAEVKKAVEKAAEAKPSKLPGMYV